METENDLLNLLLKSPNSESIRNIAQELEWVMILPTAKIEMI